MNSRDGRPSAEALLKELGSAPKLTVYLASAPGAGKTRRLLDDAIRLHESGVRVAIGWVETKGRPDLDRLVAKLPRIPPRSGRIGKATFEEITSAAGWKPAPGTSIVTRLHAMPAEDEVVRIP